MWNNIAEPGSSHDNMAHAHCMLDTKGYRHALGICNAYCFYIAASVVRTGHIVTYPNLFRNCNWCVAHHTLEVSALRHIFCFPIFPLMLHMKAQIEGVFSLVHGNRWRKYLLREKTGYVSVGHCVSQIGMFGWTHWDSLKFSDGARGTATEGSPVSCIMCVL
jgi:hypothetical protein